MTDSARQRPRRLRRVQIESSVGLVISDSSHTPATFRFIPEEGRPFLRQGGPISYQPRPDPSFECRMADCPRQRPRRLWRKQVNYFTEICSGSEAGSYSRLIDFCVTQRQFPRRLRRNQVNISNSGKSSFSIALICTTRRPILGDVRDLRCGGWIRDLRCGGSRSIYPVYSSQ